MTQVFRTVILWEGGESKISWDPKLAVEEEAPICLFPRDLTFLIIAANPKYDFGLVKTMYTISRHENGVLYPVEIKMTTMPKAIMASSFGVLDGIPDKKRGMGAVICLTERKLYLRDNLVALPLEYI